MEYYVNNHPTDINLEVPSNYAVKQYQKKSYAKKKQSWIYSLLKNTMHIYLKLINLVYSEIN